MLPVLLAAVAPAATPIPLGAATAAAVKGAAKAPGPAATPALQVNPNVDYGYLHRSPLAQHAPWLTHTFAFFFVVAAVLLIVLLAIQTTKQEGLSGTIGGRVDSNYRGRIGLEGQIARVTSYVAIAFVIVATVISISGI